MDNAPRRKQVKRRKKRLTKHHQLLADNRHRYEEILKKQGGGCALCGRKPNPNRKLDMDHDHKRMVVRGLLCFRCNRALHYWMDKTWLLNAAEYIDGEA